MAILDNFCWYSGNDPESLYKLKQAAKACFDTATVYNTPFISGKDSMFNDFKGFDEKGNPVKISIPPTLLVSAISVMNDISKAQTMDLKFPGDFIYLLGKTRKDIKVKTSENYNLYKTLQKAVEQGLTASAIGVGRGGIAVALCKTCIAGQFGADIAITQDIFTESPGRVMVSAFEKIGQVTDKNSIKIKTAGENIGLPLDTATKAYKSTLKNF
jgi:phosphoribosylformylglycinamidine synthase